ncbi:oxidoreductase 2OG FeII oxygenase [Aspergillus fumigatus]|nr:oxidoreductase 2OG FeII oxygenase [Aspergillus fumigatus]
MDYLNQVTALTEKVLQAIGVSLGYDESYFERSARNPWPSTSCFITLPSLPTPTRCSAQWPNDKYMSNVHRVINRSDVDRYCIPFNYNGNLDFVIRCIDSCRAKPEDEKYAPISVDDYIRQKYKDVYGRVGIYSVAERVKE